MSNALAKRGLTPKQRLFALEWSKDCNATQAAIRAGYSAKGADVQGHKLLTDVTHWVDSGISSVSWIKTC
jgi:phage terminase small subunit